MIGSGLTPIPFARSSRKELRLLETPAARDFQPAQEKCVMRGEDILAGTISLKEDSLLNGPLVMIVSFLHR
jgi:hypothetical protein